MYYRRKMLLALIEAFGGLLPATDCYKLMFLFCQRTQQNIYDFFPYKFGACSFILHQDKLRLIALGLLKSTDKFQLSTRESFFSQINLLDQVELQALVEEIHNLKGKRLLRKVYKEYPYFATRSLVAPDILSPEDYAAVLECKNASLQPCLFTLGYEGITIDTYLDKLIYNNVIALIDIRRNPISKKYGFSKNQFRRFLESIGVEYFHFPELGIPSGKRQHLDSPEAYRSLFNYYEKQILPGQDEAMNKIRQLLTEKKRIALTCFEASFQSCHRSVVAKHIEADPSFGVPVKHL